MDPDTFADVARRLEEDRERIDRARAALNAAALATLEDLEREGRLPWCLQEVSDDERLRGMAIVA